jgi:outer membrane protein OmpA-like peptidoglycan-associated protein
LAAAALLAGCAGGLTSTLPAVAPSASLVGVPTAALAPEAAEAEMARWQQLLGQRIAGRDWGLPVQLTRTADALLRVRIGADESFVGDSAQLQPPALLIYAELADVLRQAPASVAHVLVHGDVSWPAEPATDPTARRAASVMTYLLGRGVPGSRLRAEGRGAAEPVTPDVAAGAPESPNRRVEVVVRPIVAGREAEAWLPPPPIVCDRCAAR